MTYTKTTNDRSDSVFSVLNFVVILSIWFACIQSAQASPKNWLDLNISSRHSQPHYYNEVGAPEQFNEDNWGVGYRREFHPNWDVGAGYYRNSYDRGSLYLGVEAHTKRSRLISVGVAIGLASGYVGTPTNNVLVFLPVLQLQTPGTPALAARLGYMPVGEVKFTTFQLSLGF